MTDETPAPNSNARYNIISECAHQMNEVKAARADLNEQASDIRQRLRDADISVEAFNFACKVADRDQDDRDSFLDGVREQFMARGIGTQGTLFPAGNGEADDPRPGFLKEKTAAKDAVVASETATSSATA